MLKFHCFDDENIIEDLKIEKYETIWIITLTDFRSFLIMKIVYMIDGRGRKMEEELSLS